ncbi:Septin-domain-containing protein [Lophiotrema nucula]|uniref:Septin-domain-containing protein n=1 Tax=Lophiotrema nucula TaxID=690887 RepID=A0A6A5YPT7_9PLEO|nr:Septin-domain-containing protein [Lophiotrema nucula]
MRPSAGGDALPTVKPRSRKSSLADQPAAYNSSHVPTTFFLRSEGEMEPAGTSAQHAGPAGRQTESTFGVQSLEDTLQAAFGQEASATDELLDHASMVATPEHASSRRTSHSSSRTSSRQPEGSKASPTKKYRRKTSNNTVSAPPTPLNMDSQSPSAPSAMPSTPKSESLHSLKLSDEESVLDDVASQAMASSGEEEDTAEQTASGSFPQLVMPSIQMPTRRPFTEKGKAMGSLKVLVAGEAGIGKTSLIRSIVQLCEDIVHVDPLSPTQAFSHSPPPKSKSRKRRPESTGTSRITDIHASTKAYPPWWNDLEESRTLRRRKSSSDNVLERNLCFIDTPGFAKGASNGDDTGLVANYVESLLHQTSSVTSLEDSDLLGVVSGRSGVHVDVVFYLLPPSHDISKDIESMQRLAALTNVIPVIAKSDTLSPAELVAVKTSILARLQTTSIRPFLFGNALDDALLAVQGLAVPSSASSDSAVSMTKEKSTQPLFQTPTHPYAISSTTGPDMDSMDASLLMASDYVQPLFPSELAVLVKQVFDPESISWLRHSAAKKFLAWRRRTRLPGDSFILQGLSQQARQRGSISSSSVGLHGAPLNASTTSSMFSSTSPSGVLVPRATSPFNISNSQFNSNLQSPLQATSPSFSHSPTDGLEGPNEFSLARYNHHAHSEQRLAGVRLAKWATDLQRSLRNERDRFEELQRNERAKWLLERVGEEVREGKITTSPTTGSPRANWAVVKHKDDKETSSVQQRYSRADGLVSRDPLGLCDFSDEVRRRGFVIVKVLGGMSVLGAVMVAVVKACGVETGLPEGGIWSWITGAGAE